MAQLRKNWSDKRHPSQILKFDFHRWSVTAKTLISLYEVKNILLRHQDQSEIRAFIFEHLPTESCLPKRGWTRELSGDEARIAHNFGVWCSSIHFKSSGCWRPSAVIRLFWCFSCSCRSQPSGFVQQVQGFFDCVRHWTYLESLQGRMGNNEIL